MLDVYVVLSPLPITVWKRLEAQLKEDKAKTGEQFEDSAGNVLDKQTYEDLAGQNLL